MVNQKNYYMTTKEYIIEEVLEDFKSGIFFNLGHYDIAFKDVAIPFLKILLENSVYNKDEVSFGTVEDNTSKDRNVVVLPYDNFNYDMFLELKLRNKNIFEIQLEYYLDDDEDDGLKKFVYKLTKEDLKLVPATVLKTMRKIQKKIYGNYSREFDKLDKLEALRNPVKSEMGRIEEEGSYRETFAVKLL